MTELLHDVQKLSNFSYACCKSPVTQLPHTLWFYIDKDRNYKQVLLLSPGQAGTIPQCRSHCTDPNMPLIRDQAFQLCLSVQAIAESQHQKIPVGPMHRMCVRVDSYCSGDHYSTVMGRCSPQQFYSLGQYKRGHKTYGLQSATDNQ